MPCKTVNSTTIECTPPAISTEGPGTMRLSATPLHNSSQFLATWNISYVWKWDTALGLRPYIGEKTGHVLLKVDRQSSGQALTVKATLPFGGHAWSWIVKAGVEEAVLPFDLTKLPASINQDMKIVFTAADGSTATKFKRLIRAPVPKTSVGAVQVDMRTRGLRIDGKSWNGNGFFLWSDFMNPTALRNFSSLMPNLVKQGFNQLFMVRHRRRRRCC